MSDITDLRDRMDRARKDDFEHLKSEAYEQLHQELQHALLYGDPMRFINTPGFSPHIQPAADVINDSFAGKEGDAALCELLVILGEAARGDDGLGMRAQNWINARAEEHARFHADDLAAIWAGDDV